MRQEIPGRRAAFVVVAAAMAAILAGANIPAPLYDVYRRTMGFSPLELSAVFATYPLTLVVALWGFGRISDRSGRRPVIAAAIVASIAGSLAFAIAHSIAVLYLARFAQGISVGLLSGSASAALVELEVAGNRRKASLIATAMLAGGTAVGPLVSGLLAQYGPFPEVLSYVVHIAVLLTLGFLALRLPETAPARHAGGAWLPRIPTLPREVRVPFAIASSVAGLSWLTAAPFISLLPSYLRVTLDVHNLALVGLVAFATLGSSTLAQFAVRGLAERKLLWAALALAVVAYACIVLAVPLQALWLIWVAALVGGVGHACGIQGGLAVVTRIAPEETRGETLSLHYSILYFIVGVPMLAAGLLANGYGFFVAFSALAVCITGIAVVTGSLLATARWEAAPKAGRHRRPAKSTPQ